jgi:hypothetical protein
MGAGSQLDRTPGTQRKRWAKAHRFWFFGTPFPTGNGRLLRVEALGRLAMGGCPQVIIPRTGSALLGLHRILQACVRQGAIGPVR